MRYHCYTAPVRVVCSFTVLSSLVFCVLAPFASATPMPVSYPEMADIIYINGHILTGNGLDTDHPEEVSALAICKGNILAVGDGPSLIARYRDRHLPVEGMRNRDLRIIDLHGRYVLPGFNDAHVHLGEAAKLRLSIDLTGSRSLAEMQRRILAAAATARPGAWLTGGGWDHTLWPGRQLPSRADLDSVTLGHPAIFRRVDEHIAVANSAALALAHVTAATPQPQGGAIDHDAAGEPTGVLRELLAYQLVQESVPPISTEDRRRGIELALADASSHGVTSVQDNSDPEDLAILQQLEQTGQLPVRVSEWLRFDAPMDELDRQRQEQPADDRMLRITMLKGFMDGSLGSRTAALEFAYSDDPRNYGIPRYTSDELDALALDRGAAGFQLGFHAIGDRAVDMALEAFNVALTARMRAGITTPARYRIEHSQVVAPGDFARYAQLGVIASMQPSHLLTDMAWAGRRLGPERSTYAYAWKSFLDAGVVLAFGTDYPVEPITPFRGLYAAVTRQNIAGTQTFHPEQKITFSQAFYAYTQGSAYAEFTEAWKGRLAPGYVADFVVVDRNPRTTPPAQLLGIRVLETVVDGRSMYKAPRKE